MSTIIVNAALLAVSVVLGALAAYLGIWLVERTTKRLDEWKAIRDGNAAVGLTLAAAVVGMAIVLRPALTGALPPFTGRLAPDLAPVVATGVSLLLILVRALVAIVLGAGAIFLAVWLFSRLTRDLDEIAELERGNVAAAALLCGTIIAISLLVSPIAAAFTDSLAALLFP